MIKIYISLPMKGKSRSEILSEQAKILARVNEKLGEPVMLVENYLDDNGKLHPLECLGESLKRMSHADYAVFADGWENARGCMLERNCAEAYSIPILKL